MLSAMVFALLLSVASPASGQQAAVALVNAAIAQSGADWTAGETSMSVLPLAERTLRCGVNMGKAPIPPQKPLVVAPAAIPSHFDWRAVEGENWVTPIRDQGPCGSCWDFSAVGVFEAIKKIAGGDPSDDASYDFSEQFILSCCPDCGDCLFGGWPSSALQFLKDTGTVTEACLPYAAADTIACSSACNELPQTIGNWAPLTDSVEAIKQAIYAYGPVSATFTVYDDFFYYTGGVYTHVWGNVAGGHAVVIVGWDDLDQAWICKNSWGTQWGETIDGQPYTPGHPDAGWFRIQWGECSIESGTHAATLTSWSASIEVRVLDARGLGVSGAEIFRDGSSIGQTGSDGSLNLEAPQGTTCEILAVSQEARLALAGSVSSPGTLVLDARQATEVEIAVIGLDGSALSQTGLYFSKGSDDRVFFLWLGAPRETFFVTPQVYDILASAEPSLEGEPAYALFLLGVDLTSDTSVILDAHRNLTAQIRVGALPGFDVIGVAPQHEGFSWTCVWELEADDWLVLFPGDYSLGLSLVPDLSTRRFEYWLASSWWQLAPGQVVSLNAGGELSVSVAADKSTCAPGSGVTLVPRMHDAFQNEITSVYGDPWAGSMGARVLRLGSGQVIEYLDTQGGDWESVKSWGYLPPTVMLTSPSGHTVFEGETCLGCGTEVWLASNAEAGQYVITASQETHVGTLTGTGSLSVVCGEWLDEFEYPDQASMEAAGWSLTGSWCLVGEWDFGWPTLQGLVPFPSCCHAAYFGNPREGSFGGVSAKALSADLTPQSRAQARLQSMQAGHPYGELTSPSICVAGQFAVEIAFAYFRQVECYTGGPYDQTYVQVSFDGGDWKTVWSQDSRFCGASEQGVWIPRYLDGLAFDGATRATVAVPAGGSGLRVRFVFDAVDNWGNNYLGWVVDNVRISPAGSAGLGIEPRSLAPGTLGRGYREVVEVVGGTPPYSWRVHQAPEWLSTQADGATLLLLGTPASEGTFPLCVGVSDARGQTADRCYEIPVAEATIWHDDFEGSQANAWDATGLWHLASGSTCIATPYTSPSHAYFYGREATCSYVMPSPSSGYLTSPPIDVSSLALGGGAVGLSWRSWRTVEFYAGGSFDQTWAEVSLDGQTWQEVWRADSTVPCESAWTKTEVQGVPVPQGAEAMWVRFGFNTVDGYANNYLGWLIDDVTVAEGPPAPLAAGGCPLPAGAEGQPYGPVELQASGGVPPYVWAAVGLPTGLQCSGTGTISGTPGPGAAKTYSVTLTVSDCKGSTASQTCDLLIASAPCPCLLYEELFDGAQNWTTTGLWHVTPSKACVNCAALLGSYAYFGQDAKCNYSTGIRVEGALSLPSFTIPGCVGQIAVEFDHFRHVESVIDAYDRTWLEVSRNGLAWETIWERNATDPSPTCEHVALGYAIPAGTTSVALRFRFDSVDKYYNTFPGWAVDNVRVWNASCFSGSVLAVDAASQQANVPSRGAVGDLKVANIPNPVRDVNTTTFVVRGLGVEAIRVQVYDLNETLVFEEETEGNELVWHTQDSVGAYLANGVYFYRAWARIDDTWYPTAFEKVVILR